MKWSGLIQLSIKYLVWESKRMGGRDKLCARLQQVNAFVMCASYISKLYDIASCVLSVNTI